MGPSRRRGRALGLLVALALVAIALLVSFRQLDSTPRSTTAAVRDAHVIAALPAVIRDLAPRASVPEVATRSTTTVVVILGALLGLVALAAPRAIEPAVTTGLARRRAPPRV